MSKGMLGMLPLSAVQGPKATLDEMLAGPDGLEVLEQLKRFTRREPCWASRSSVEQGTTLQQMKGWKSFYLRVFKRVLDDATLRIPTSKEDFTRLIVVLPGLKIEEVLAQCKKRFPVWRWTQEDLDQITKSTRNATTEPYAIWVRDIPEADPVHANKSYNGLAQEGIVGVTLLERLLYELKYFMETGKHLDIQNVTLCTGTLYSDDSVTRVDWGDGKLYVYWSHRDNADPHLRVREAGVN